MIITTNYEEAVAAIEGFDNHDFLVDNEADSRGVINAMTIKPLG